MDEKSRMKEKKAGTKNLGGGGGARFFASVQTGPGADGYRISLPGVKRTGRGLNCPLPLV